MWEDEDNFDNFVNKFSQYTANRAGEQDVFSDLAQNFILSGGAQQSPPEPRNLYWDPRRGGTGKVDYAPYAPSLDHFRLVDSEEEAQHAIDQGEMPVIYLDLMHVDPSTITPEHMNKLVEEQHAAPGGSPIFTRDASGKIILNRRLPFFGQ